MKWRRLRDRRGPLVLHGAEVDAQAVGVVAVAHAPVAQDVRAEEPMNDGSPRSTNGEL